MFKEKFSCFFFKTCVIFLETTDTDIITTEIIKRRDVGPYGIRSEYCIRRIICPLGNRDTPKGKKCIPLFGTNEVFNPFIRLINSCYFL